MSVQQIDMPSGSISMSNRTADKLISEASGDGALLFLYLLRCSGHYDPYAAGKALSWDGTRVSKAFEELENLQLVKGIQVDKTPTISAAEAPDYTAEMITEEMSSPSSHFPALLHEVERKLGNKMSIQNMRQLMELYDYLALPPEVIYLLVSYLVEETVYRKGAGMLPKMYEIKREGYRWANKGLDNLEAATAYVEKMTYFRSQEGKLLAAVGINDRKATQKERVFLLSWLEMGFGEEAVSLAYENTLFHIKVWKWQYCNGILKNWHNKNLHSADEIIREERHRWSSSTPSGSSGSQKPTAAQAQKEEEQVSQDLQWIQAYMKNRSAQGGAT